MPLRDHFRPPLANRRHWEGFYAVWPGMIVQRLSHWMSQDYVAEPRVHLGSMMEVDIGTFDEDHVRASGVGPTSDDGGVAVAAWAPARPTLTIVTDPPALYEYAVKVYDMSEGRRLVAVVEFVSPAN